ncbi:preprotein translocase subunit SecA [Candidatus Aerophobetes bacterium]|uniref:Protein translocase subunit SecA n=1 Tax=Aerophobetes bacterium TaxID=2030807 RepID=A0A662D495_UNCAE|nr:MAG: preprotein translocase subunit SecA [Candidatus Aerophobetes bacterium]
MVGKLLVKVFGTEQERNIKRLLPIVNKINGWEKKIAKLSDKALQRKTDEFRGRLKRGESLDELLPEAFAVVRETAKRVIKLRHHDVQLMGGIVLHQGKIAEMANGEGKTLVATLPAYLNALEGKGVHIVTVNDYLARRDREWMGPVYEFLGLSVGVIQSQMDNVKRRQAYQCDITYGTNNEFGFDYLRDNMALQIEDCVQRDFNYAIVDEVDSILIDEARTPLIISGPAEKSTELYYRIDKIVPLLKRGRDYEVDEKDQTVALTEEGVARVEKLLRAENLLKADNLYQDQMDLVTHVNQAIRAHELYKRDRDYLVKDGEVVIIDEFTGRLMPGRRWSDGLHQAIEAKERVNIRNENQTLATITLQNYFRMYKKLAGMTGTASTEAAEFKKIYNLDVVTIPTHRPVIREDLPDKIYQTEEAKFKAVIEKVEDLYKKERPVLVGTRSVEKSEILSRMLRNRGIPHTVLNAKYHEKEAQIVAQAGQKRAVTIATNMAGRGTDIKLGEGVRELGGLFVIGTERHESRRIDNQLRGRAGRQGAPGADQFYVSLDDELMRLFGSERIASIMNRLKIPEDQPIEHPWINRALERAQERVEQRNFEIRKQLLEYDDVMNKQREVIYKERRKVLENKNLKENVLGMIEDTVEGLVSLYTNEKVRPEEWDTHGLIKRLKQLFPIEISLNDLRGIYNRKELVEIAVKEVKKAYSEKEARLGEELMRALERMVLLHIIDSRWKDHLYAMDRLKEGIGLRGYGQRDPLVEYKREAYEMFEDLIQRIKEGVTEFIFKLEISREPYSEKIPTRNSHTPQPVLTGVNRNNKNNYIEQRRQASHSRKRIKIGRNDPCPCGSGKKYKYCCGRNKRG